MGKIKTVFLFTLFTVFRLFFPEDSLAVNAPDINSSRLYATTTGSDSAPADGTSQVKVTVVLKDAYGNYLVGDTVSLAYSSAYSLSVTPSTAILNSSGAAEFIITSYKVGVYTLDVFDNSQSVTLGALGQVAFYSPICHDSAPGSAPKLVSATAISTNQITLKWEEASDPVTYYLVSYGTSSGGYIYGNPNVGGKGTTSYTVGGLTAGKKYYFAVRAGNGCTPGAFSSELSATTFSTNATTQATTKPTTTTKPTKTTTPKQTETPTPIPQPTTTSVATKTSFFSSSETKIIISMVMAGLVLLGLGVFFAVKQRRTT